MLFLPGIDSKSYWTLLARGMPIPEVACPRCRHCRVSHALLPEDVCAYRDLTLPVLEAAMHSRDGPSAAARAAGQRGPAAVRQARRGPSTWELNIPHRWVRWIVGLDLSSWEGGDVLESLDSRFR